MTLHQKQTKEANYVHCQIWVHVQTKLNIHHRNFISKLNSLEGLFKASTAKPRTQTLLDKEETQGETEVRKLKGNIGLIIIFLIAQPLG
jgi:hypothetical protein